MDFISDSAVLTAKFKELCDRYDHYMWMTAWAGDPNFDMVEILEQNISKLKIMVVGLHFFQTSPEFIRKFRRYYNIKYMMQSDGTFHPKVYLFYNNYRDWAAIVGSSNLTNAGFHKNIEANVLISSEDGNPSMFNQIQNVIDECFGEAKIMQDDLFENYERMYKYQRSHIESLSAKTSGRAKQSDFDLMTWGDYYETIRQSEELGVISDRLEILNQACNIFTRLEDDGKSFNDLNEEWRKKIAGIPNDSVFEEEELDWKWFGSMVGAGWFKKEIISGEKIGKAIDLIPVYGSITRDVYEEYCDVFRAVCGENPLATATRLLAIKRPDIFVCVDSKNILKLSEALNIPANKITLDTYWSSVVMRIQRSVWYNDKTPKRGVELDLFNNRVAMLDCFYYNGK